VSAQAAESPAAVPHAPDAPQLRAAQASSPAAARRQAAASFLAPQAALTSQAA